MAIDAGTGSIRAVIFDTNGEQISVSQIEWSHLEENGVPYSMQFDFEKNWGLVVSCIQNSIKEADINADIFIIIAKKGFSSELKSLKGESLKLYTLKNFKELLQ